MRRRLPTLCLALAVLLGPGGLVGSPGPAHARRDLRRAVAQFRQALERDPEDTDAMVNLGQALSRLGQRQEAAERFRRAIEIAPTRGAAYAGLADLLAEDPRRWELRDETLKLLEDGLRRVDRKADPAGFVNLVLSTAIFERAVGRTAAARARLRALASESGEAVPLSPEQRQRLADLAESIQTQEHARALIDWPEPKVPDTAVSALQQAEALLPAAPERARAQAERLKAAYPGWRAPRWLRARALMALDRHDDAERELTVLLQLAPSHGPAWRHLGRILATHGGVRDADRADEALRHALAIEPAHFDLWLLRAQVALRRNRPDEAQRAVQRFEREAAGPGLDPAAKAEVERIRAAIAAQLEAARAHAGSGRAADPPTDQARQKLREAQMWLSHGDPLDWARDLLHQALLDSPAYVEAAATLYALTGQVPERTLKALWYDGEGLLELARKVKAAGPPAVARGLIRPWLDRAVSLGLQAARFERGLLRIEEGEREGGIIDLMHYVADEPAPAGLEEARGALTDLQKSAPGDVDRDPARILSRVKLLSDRPREAADLLGGRCDGKTAGERLLALGTVFEWAGDLGQAVTCYREALRRQPAAPEPLARLSGIGARAPVRLLGSIEPELWRAAGQKAPPAGAWAGAGAHWGLARLLIFRGEGERALPHLQRFLSQALPDDPGLPRARAERDRLLRDRAQAARRQDVRNAALGGAGLILAGLLLLARLRGAPLQRALSRRPALFPAVARTIGELRHDVLKHRTSVLGLLDGGDAAVSTEVWEDVARVLWEPERASDLLLKAYEDLRQAARGRGVGLRPIAREPVFGPLYRDLRRAEALVRYPSASARSAAALLRIDERMRQHTERLGGLLRLSPRTRLSPDVVAGWVRDVQAELRVRELPWASPVLHLQAMDLEFPVERGALSTIFANLLRNAQAAAAAAGTQALAQERERAEPGVLLRIAEERDETGRRFAVLLLCDTAPPGLTLEAIEARESGRGLAIVRDLVHEWRGHLLIRPEAAPFQKGVGACFPL
jgi:tetratricopeptide (TPR) repeat protein